MRKGYVMPKRENKIKNAASIEEKLAEIDLKIDRHQRNISTLREHKQKLQKDLERMQYSELLDAIKKSGKTPAEIIQML